MHRLEEIGAAASKEYSLEKAMDKMKTEWEETEFTFIEYRDTVSSVCVRKVLQAKTSHRPLSPSPSLTLPSSHPPLSLPGSVHTVSN